ncbi:MAG: hypothetical protein KC657_17690 [Myxococcales bacterium]|nr:hypothetical protein [Myxococcales bacterium]
MVDKRRELGLKAIKGARDDRERTKFGRITPRVWVFAAASILSTMVVARMYSGRELGNAKETLLQKQRAADKTVGARWYPLRDRIESFTVDAAKAYKGDLVTPEAATLNFRTLPGIYLRLRTADAQSVESIHKVAPESVKDGFTSCLLRTRNDAAARGEPDAGAAPDQPWNLRQAYASTRILTEDWVREVRESPDTVRLRIFEDQYDKAEKNEIPKAIDIVTRAQFFLLVLDEDADAARQYAEDGGGITTEALQQVPHAARVHVLNLKTGEEMLRVRREADGQVRMVSDGQLRDPEIRAALRRQVNNCALAQNVLDAARPAAPAATDAGTDATTDAAP